MENEYILLIFEMIHVLPLLYLFDEKEKKMFSMIDASSMLMLKLQF